MPTQAVTEPPRRVQALDALRGIAILMMVLSGEVPGAYPAWMHHAQCPPPTMQFNPSIPGITWVDLVFPFFIFSMGAAIPLALGRRMEKGEKAWKLTLDVIQRFLLLGLFAVYVAHIRPFEIDAPMTWQTWVTALVAFAAMFGVLVRLPKAWKLPLRLTVRAAGWAIAIALMHSVRLADGARFDLQRYDIIILILANVALGVSLVWALTRTNVMMRVGYMGVLMAIRLSGAGPGWVQSAWDWSPEHWLYAHGLYVTPDAWLFHPSFLNYLFVAIPGTLVGDLLVKWLRAPKDAEGPAWSAGRWWGIAGLSFSLVPVLLWGLFTRHHLVGVTVTAAVICTVVRWLASKPVSTTEKLVRDIAAWGAFWLILGLLFEPYEGGIKKDSATMSYYFVSAGLACFVLIAFTSVMDALRKPWALRLLADNGQNPMIAYVGLSNLVQPLLFLTGLNPLMDKWDVTPNGMFLHGVIAVALVALAVSGFTRAKVFLRT